MATQEELDARAADLDAREKALAEREAQDNEADRQAEKAVGEPATADDILTVEERSVSDREKAARPKLDHNPETPDEVRALAEEFAQYRKEVAALRAELAQH